MKRLVGIATTGVVAIASALAFAGGGSAKIGAKLPFDGLENYGTLACNQAPHCVYVQRQIADGGVTRAPFNGRLRKWTLVQPAGSFRVAVVRKVGADIFKLVRWSSIKTVGDPNPLQRFTFDTNLKIRKGDFAGIVSEDFGSSNFVFRGSDTQSPDSCRIGFVNGLYPGDSATPGISYNICSQLLLYNAKIVR